VCVQDAAEWRGDALKTGLLEQLVGEASLAAITGKDALAKAQAVLAGQRILPQAEGVLTATRVLGATPARRK